MSYELYGYEMLRCASGSQNSDIAMARNNPNHTPRSTVVWNCHSHGSDEAEELISFNFMDISPKKDMDSSEKKGFNNIKLVMERWHLASSTLQRIKWCSLIGNH